VVKSKSAPVVMIPSRSNQGWERGGYGTGRGRAGGRFGYREYAWHREQGQQNFSLGRGNPQMVRDQRQMGIGNMGRDQR
jgi:hypothetical protein